jgi:hypothetical protein
MPHAKKSYTGTRSFSRWAPLHILGLGALEENTGIRRFPDQNEKLPEGLVRTWREAHYAEPGFLLFLQGSRLVAQRFDTTRLRLIGEPHSLPELVGMNWTFTGRAMFSVSPSGVLAYQESVPLAGARVVWRDRAGKQLRSIEAPQASSAYPFSLAPDEKRVAVTTDDENTLEDLWVGLERATSLRLTATHASSTVAFGRRTPVESPSVQIRRCLRSLRKGSEWCSDEELR